MPGLEGLRTASRRQLVILGSGLILAVGLALALAAHPEAHEFAVMVEEKTRQSGLLPRCDFDARTLGSASSGQCPLGKLI